MSVRRELLDEAADLIDGDRNTTYGDPNDDFSRTAAYWSIHANGVLKRKLAEEGLVLDPEVSAVLENLFDAHDVAIMMMQLKISRLSWSPGKRDHWVDAAGYSACGFDCVDRD